MKYKKTYHNEEKLPQKVAICFLVDNYKVDKELRKNNYLFRENLKWNKSEMDWFLGLSAKEQEEFVRKKWRYLCLLTTKCVPFASCKLMSMVYASVFHQHIYNEF